MTALAIAERALPVDPVPVFRDHCEARAALYEDGLLDLHDAVDGLQAIAWPLIDTIGQDAVQTIMAEAFRPVWVRNWRRRRTKKSTVDALLYALRRGLCCLSDPANRDRLRNCDAPAMNTIARSLLTGECLKSHWSEENVATLIKAWRAVRRRAW